MEMAARWWREWEFWVVVLLAALIYGPRLGAALPSGEETRWGQAAREMISGGDWVVPRQQGLPFLSRPPLQPWAIAAAAAARGNVDAAAIRIPSVSALLFTTALIYAFGRTFLSRLGALWAATAYPTMGLVLQFGWLGETESLYTLIVAASLIAWRWAEASGKPLLGWCAGYALAALGMLTKGPQAPLYFAGGIGLFLVLAGRGRELFRWQHAAGIFVFLAVWFSWEIPFCFRVTSRQAWSMLTGDMAARFHDPSWSRIGKHLVEFPPSVAACLLPWGVLLLAYFSREFRRGIGFARTDVLFLGTSIGFAFLTCYVAPGARNRYLAPMLPLAALLIGLAAQQCHASSAGPMRLLRRRYFVFAGFLCAGLGLWIVAATVLRLGAAQGQQTAAFALGFALAAAAAAALVLWGSARPTIALERLGILILAAFLGLTYRGAVVNTFIATWHPIGTEIADATAGMPEGVELVSIGPVDHPFLYFYGRPIRQLSAGAGVGCQEHPWTWFCMNGPESPRFDPPYEKVATISMESGNTDNPRRTVIIGRRLSQPTAQQLLGSAARPPM
jgi:4-amino-4-deoxy-L-arabinose transferase-like glycosyltransferase